MVRSVAKRRVSNHGIAFTRYLSAYAQTWASRRRKPSITGKMAVGRRYSACALDVRPNPAQLGLRLYLIATGGGDRGARRRHPARPGRARRAGAVRARRRAALGARSPAPHPVLDRFFCNRGATAMIYTLSLHDDLRLVSPHGQP